MTEQLDPWQLIADWLAMYSAWLVAGSLLLLLVLLVLTVRRDRDRGLQQWLDQRLLEQSRELMDGLDRSRQELAAVIARTQAQLQEGQQQSNQRLERQLIEDAGKLRLELIQRFEHLQKTVAEALADGRSSQQRSLAEFKDELKTELGQHRETFLSRQGEALKAQQETFNNGVAAVSKRVEEALARSSEDLGKRVDGLTTRTDERLKEISGQVEQRLAKGFEKTTETFTRVLEHLSRIDEAQKKITELSSNVVSLQEVLTDKRSRGAFGEVQLAGLVRNVMPEGSFALQHTLSNGTRVDCLLRLPEPTGNVAIDAKFPLESYKRLADPDLSEPERQLAGRQFVVDIKKHIKDISEKYLIAGETADGAVMFLPAEAIFAEIHARYPELVEEAQRARVWLVSPTTLMAVLTTARAVLKDEATRKQVHIIQDHLRRLSTDFGRFQQRMDKLSVHIAQAHKDVEQVNTSARKISSRFEKIEKVELEEIPSTPDADGLLTAESGERDAPGGD
jgi:DNA recombination protein RmuC